MNSDTKISAVGSSKANAPAFVASLEAAIKLFRMYPPDHPACNKAIEKPFAEIRKAFEEADSVVIAVLEGVLSANGLPVGIPGDTSVIADALKELGIKSVVVSNGVNPDELSSFLHFFSSRVGKAEQWGDLQEHISSNGIKHIEIDTLRYELIQDGEKVVPEDAVIGEGIGDGVSTNKVTLEFAKLVKDHPEFLIGLLSDRDSAERKLCGQLEAEVDFDKLFSEIDCKINGLGDSQIVQIVSDGLKRRISSDEAMDVEDLEQSLFGIQSMLEKINNPSIVPKIKRLVEELNLIDEKYIDMILDGKYSKKRYAFERLEEIQAKLDSHTINPDEARLIPKRLETLNDAEYADRMLEKLFAGTTDSDEEALAEDWETIETLIDSAIESDCAATCKALVERIQEELSDVGIRPLRLRLVCAAAEKLARWLLNEQELDLLAGLVRAIHKFSDGEVRYDPGVEDTANEFILNMGSNATCSELVNILKADFDSVSKRIYELLMMLRTQESALALMEHISYPDRPVRLFVVRVLSDYRGIALHAFDLAISDGGIVEIPDANEVLPQETWFRVRNIVFVAGNTRMLEAVDLIETFVSHTDARVAEEVLTALEKIGGERASSIVVGYLYSPDDQIRAKAVHVLGNIGGPETVKYLFEAYEERPELRSTLVPVIAHVGGEASVDFLGDILMRREGHLKEMFSKGSEKEKLAVIRAIERIKSPKTIAKLEEFRRSLSSGIAGFFKSNVLTRAVDEAIARLQRQLTAGQNSG